MRLSQNQRRVLRLIRDHANTRPESMTRPEYIGRNNTLMALRRLGCIRPTRVIRPVPGREWVLTAKGRKALAPASSKRPTHFTPARSALRILSLEGSIEYAHGALVRAKQLFDQALPKFNWKASALDAAAVTLLNTVPGEVARAIEAIAPHRPKNEPPPPWARDDAATLDMLELTGQGRAVPLVAIQLWTDDECKEAEEWAGASHLRASDNDVTVPPIPKHVKQWDTPEDHKRKDQELAELRATRADRGQGMGGTT